MTRKILDRWSFPRDLDSFPSGKPPFDPFPTVTEVTSAYICPLAIYHYLLHGEKTALVPRTDIYSEENTDIGTFFHNFIVYLKMQIKEGKLPRFDLRFVYQEFLDFSKNLKNPNRIWEIYIQQFVKRKMNEFETIKSDSKIYSEITVASSRIKFKTESGGERTYPCTGRIDEINFDEKKIIERTIKDSSIPKDYQVWLLWKILCSIDKKNYPTEWKDVNFEDFKLVVETPNEDFEIDKNNLVFEYKTHECYAWIHDLTFDPKAIREACDDDQRACSYEKKKQDCGLAWMCYCCRPQYPECRPEMRRIFKEDYRALLWEKMWKNDLLQYKFVIFDNKELQEKKILCKAKIVSKNTDEKTLKVKVISDPEWTKMLDEDARFLVIPFGNTSIGLRIDDVVIKSASDENLIIKMKNLFMPQTKEVFIAPLDSDILIFGEEPHYLITNVQRDVHRLDFHGVKSKDKADSDSKVQLLECIFGRKGIRRGKS